MPSLVWPATCKTITQRYGNKNARYVRGYHTGIDMGCMAGSPIYAAHDGTVSFSGWNGAYGNEVRVKANDSFETSYHHMSKIAVRKGENVSAGKVIGYIGSTGMSTGPHLHFEVRLNGKDVDPAPYLSGSSVVPVGSGSAAPAGLTDIPSAVTDAFSWLSNTVNWYRMGLVALGAILLLMSLLGIAKTQALGKTALNTVKGAVKK